MAKKQADTSDVTDAAHKIFLAGLGALATAGREGEKLFNTLVSRGEKLEQKVDPAVDRASASVRKTVKDVRSRAGRTLDNIQTAIDDGVSSALHRLGVPTRSEIVALTKRVERLTHAVEGKKTARKKPTRKATKRTVSKKSTRKATKTTAAKKKTAKRRAARA